MAESPVIIVTGASRGMGADAARWLGSVGASCVLTARSGDGLRAVARDVEKLGGLALAVPGDAASPGHCGGVVDAAVDRFGRIDGLINNAGVLGPMAYVESADPEQWRHNIEVNLLAPFRATRAALPHLRRGHGRVVTVSSGAAENPVEGWSAYCAAKAGVTHLNRVLASEVPEVTFVALRPGVVDTHMQTLIREDGPDGMNPEKAEYFRRLKADGALEPPFVPARAMAWLVLYAASGQSGRFLEYDDETVAGPATERFGHRPPWE